MIALFSTLRKYFFPYLHCNSGQFTVSCLTADLKLSQKTNSVKKQCEIWNFEEKCPTVEFRLWVRVRVSFRVGAIFLAGNLWKFVKHWWKWSQIYYSIINWLGHEQICLMRLIEHIRWWRVLINEHWKYRRKSKIYSDLRWC